MDWTEMLKALFIADVVKAGIVFGVVALLCLAWYIAYWMTR